MGNRIKKKAKITSKGQITIPREVRRALGVGTGDSLLFEQAGSEVVIRPVRVKSAFAKYQGIGNPSVPSGRKAIVNYVRRMRGR